MKRYFLYTLITICTICAQTSCASMPAGVSDIIGNAVNPSNWSGLFGSGDGTSKGKEKKSKPQITYGRIGVVCSMCNGEGRVVRNLPTEITGEDKIVRCKECRKKYRLSEGHTHVDCPICRRYK